MKLLEPIVKLYKTTAVIALTTVLLLVAVVSFMVLYESWQAVEISNVNPRIYNAMISRDDDALRTVYPGKDIDDIRDLLLETWARPYIYEPFTQFKERPYSGKYVNVDKAGFRHVGRQAPWPPNQSDYVIFVFGGSTTFGYGVSDSDTIPSKLLDILETSFSDKSLAVYNFGRGYFYSTQERILLEQLLAGGFVPSMAIFIDGLNEFLHSDNKPMMTSKLSGYVDKPIKQETFSSMLADFKKQALDVSKYLQNNALQGKEMFGSRKMNGEVVKNYYANKRMISAISSEYGVIPVFVWQPVPTYKYNVLFHLFASGGFGGHGPSITGYTYMHDVASSTPDDDHFLWLADIQEDLNKPLYVDKVHYTAEFSTQIAEKIAGYLLDNGLIRFD
jgi:hypothetical protein